MFITMHKWKKNVIKKIWKKDTDNAAYLWDILTVSLILRGPHKNLAEASVVSSAITTLCHPFTLDSPIINVTARSARVKYTKRGQPEAQWQDPLEAVYLGPSRLACRPHLRLLGSLFIFRDT